jgi:hypothetical protein
MSCGSLAFADEGLLEQRQALLAIAAAEAEPAGHGQERRVRLVADLSLQQLEGRLGLLLRDARLGQQAPRVPVRRVAADDLAQVEFGLAEIALAQVHQAQHGPRLRVGRHRAHDLLEQRTRHRQVFGDERRLGPHELGERVFRRPLHQFLRRGGGLLGLVLLDLRLHQPGQRRQLVAGTGILLQPAARLVEGRSPRPGNRPSATRIRRGPASSGSVPSWRAGPTRAPRGPPARPPPPGRPRRGRAAPQGRLALPRAPPGRPPGTRPPG